MNISLQHISHLEQKEQIGREIISHVKNGQVIGVGSGSTSLVALHIIAEKIRAEALHCMFIPTSHEMTLACAALNLTVTSLMAQSPDWYFDGADEIDPNRNLIKGRGGALFREKLVMKASPKTYILADHSKFVDRLGSKFPVPVEVFPEAFKRVERDLQVLGATEIIVRSSQGKDGPVITEQGCFLLDTRFKDISPPLEKEIKNLPGVLESGLFMGYDVEIVTG